VAHFRLIIWFVALCSIKTLSAVANSFSHNLLIRVVDVNLEKKKESNPSCSGNALSRRTSQSYDAGNTDRRHYHISVSVFYYMPRTIENIIHQSVGKALDLFFGSDAALFRRWGTSAKDETKALKISKTMSRYGS
jgi:4-hydroxy-3-polyprenylbenzoate decarboxylase